MHKTRYTMNVVLIVFFLNLFYSNNTFSDTIANGDFETSGGWTYSTSNTYWSTGYDSTISHGGTSSYKVTWPSNGIGTVGDYADITQTITVPSALRFYEIDLWVKDDYTSGCLKLNFPYKQILVDGVVIWEDSVQGNETSNGWMHVIQDVTPQLMGKTQALITLRTYYKQVSDRDNNMLLSMMLNTNISDGNIFLGAMWDNGTYSWAVTNTRSPRRLGL